jgi:hypothetical protein
MDPHIDVITLAVNDLERSLRLLLAGGALVLLASIVVRVPTRRPRPGIRLPIRAPLTSNGPAVLSFGSKPQKKTTKGEMR